MYKKILVPLDGSGLAECVFQHVKAVATGCSVPEVDLLYVVQGSRFPYDVGFEDAYFGNLPADVRDEGIRKAEEWGKEYLAKIADDMKGAGVAARSTILRGNAAEQILDFATKNSADLILLDLNMPKKDGRETLAEIKQDEKLKCIPVIVLTVSSVEEDIFKAYNFHANCYITKPIDLDQFVKVVNSVENFWFTIVRLPQ